MSGQSQEAATKVLQDRLDTEHFSYRLTANHTSNISGISHWYFEQRYHDIPIYHALASIHLDPTDKLVFFTNQVIKKDEAPDLSFKPTMTVNQAAGQWLKKLHYSSEGATAFFEEKNRLNYQLASGSNLDFQANARLVLYRDSLSNWHLAWEYLIIPETEPHLWLAFVDAHAGDLIKIRDLALHCSPLHEQAEEEHFICNPNYDFPNTDGQKAPDAGANQFPNGAPASFLGSYYHFPHPVESPIYGSRTTLTADQLINTTASPFGWHNTTTTPGLVEFEYTRGNNIYAYYDPSGIGSNPTAIPIATTQSGVYLAGNVPNGGPMLNFNFNSNITTQTPSFHLRDAITNAFVWTNQLHDWLYLYGFTESAGNFQHNNYGNGGLGNDHVQVECQDGGDTNNANFTTPPEGQRPTMQLYIWEDGPLSTNPPRDACFDNNLIAHEYAHGLSMRLAQGPFNTNCLTGPEQGGEGWSDFYGLLFTMKDQNGNNVLDENVVGEGIRGLGNYLLDQSAAESGVRPAPYSTDFSINDFTYGDTPGMAQPHGVGFVWGTMLWEVTWELINLYGFEPNLENTSSTAGNIRALKIVTESLKMVPCQPDFIDMRDALLAANMSIYGGQAQGNLWAAFARRGLGASASSGGNEAFDEPSLHVSKFVDREMAIPGETLTYTVQVRNSGFSNISNTVATDLLSSLFDPGTISVSAPGYLQNGEVIYPIYNTMAPGDIVTFTITGTIRSDAPTSSVLYENGVNGLIHPDFVTLGAVPVTDLPYEGSHSWFMAEAGAPSEISLILNLNIPAVGNYHLSFWHLFDTEASFDGAVVEIQQGLNWIDLGDKMIRNSYNSTISSQNIIGIPTSTIDGRRAFSGNSNGYVNTVIDLTDYSGAQSIRFRLVTDESTPGNGWFLDFFQLIDLVHITNTACATANGGLSACGDVGAFGTIVNEGAPLPVDFLSFEGRLLSAQTAQLNWQVAGEENNRGFEVQRRSETDDNFKNVGWVAANTGQSDGKYVFLDNSIQAGVRYYYRIRQVDFDGQVAFSRVISLYNKGDEIVFRLFPNPTFTQHVYLSTNTPPETPITVGIYNISGKLVSPPQDLSIKASPSLIDLPGLPSGIYLIKITEGSQHFVQRLAVQ
jgi:extracellular elastinolytic metalloproteinase